MSDRKRFLLVFLGALFLGALPVGSSAARAQQDSAEVFKTANTAYRSGNFEAAAEGYQSLLGEHSTDPAILYNFGNTYYRLGKLGPSILFYERALLTDPRDADIRKNLNFVQSLLEYRVEDTRNWYLKAGENLLGHFTEHEIRLLTAFCYLLFASSWGLAVFLRRNQGWGWLRKSLAGLTVLAVLLLTGKHFETRIIRDAVVMTNDAEVRYGPSSSDQLAFRIGEGLKVYVIDKRTGWSRILLTNGQGGWILSDHVEEVIQG